jgi:hypothetical protein
VHRSGIGQVGDVLARRTDDQVAARVIVDERREDRCAEAVAGAVLRGYRICGARSAYLTSTAPASGWVPRSSPGMPIARSGLLRSSSKPGPLAVRVVHGSAAEVAESVGADGSKTQIITASTINEQITNADNTANERVGIAPYLRQ